MTLVLESVVAGAAALSAVAAWVAVGSSKRNAGAAKHSADAANRTANSMEKQLQAEREKRYDPLAEQTHLWKFERYVELADAVVRIFTGFKSDDREMVKAAGKDYAEAQRRLVLLIDGPVVEKALAFGRQFQRLNGFLRGAQELREQDREILEELGKEYIKAMFQVLHAARSSYDSGLSEEYVDFLIENQGPVPPNMTEDNHA